jgi:hypothetical protein
MFANKGIFRWGFKQKGSEEATLAQLKDAVSQFAQANTRKRVAEIVKSVAGKLLKTAGSVLAARRVSVYGVRPNS